MDWDNKFERILNLYILLIVIQFINILYQLLKGF
jgi:hypothetical protein